MERVNDGQWHLITATNDRDSKTGVRIYVDGELKYTGNALYRPDDLTNDSDLIVGGVLGNSNQRFVCILDEVRFYDRLLEQEEIGNLYADFFNSTSFSFDSGLQDISGSGSPASCAKEYYAAGVKNEAIDLEYSGAVSVADNPSLDFETDNFAVSFWIKRRDLQFSNYQQIVQKLDFATYTGFGIHIYESGWIFLLGDLTGASGTSFTLPASIDTDWHHLVFNVERGTPNAIKVYLDGIKVITFSNRKIYSISNDVPLLVGKSAGVNWLYQDFTGNLDELDFYNRTLTDAEVLAIYNNQ